MGNPATAPIASGAEMHDLIRELYPICRSITGNGVRQTLEVIRRRVPLKINEVPSGTRVFDWTVPKEWNIRDAYIKTSRGDRVVDFQKCNLHVVSYSVPVKTKLSLNQLKAHLHTLPEHPDWIPYRTSYYKEDWGFCLSHRQYLELQEDEYEVCIDSSLTTGSLTYGELFLPGEEREEVLISCHICHPSLCNDNLSGIVVAGFLAEHLACLRRRYGYRFLFLPGTIGAITWLCQHEAIAHNIKHGLVLANLGDAGPFTYKKSRRDNAEIDRVVAHVLGHCCGQHQILEFSPYGYDERQYCSPGFNLPVGCFMRTPEDRGPEYHTSADNLNYVTVEGLAGSLHMCASIVSILEKNNTYINLYPKCEPQLGRRGIYRTVGGPSLKADNLSMLWLLNLSDGFHSSLDVAERSGLPFWVVQEAAATLLEHGLLKYAGEMETAQ